MIQDEIVFGLGHSIRIVFDSFRDRDRSILGDVVGVHLDDMSPFGCHGFIDRLPDGVSFHSLRCRTCGWTFSIPSSIKTWLGLKVFAGGGGKTKDYFLGSSRRNG